jgi:hypothetical protein
MLSGMAARRTLVVELGWRGLLCSGWVCLMLGWRACSLGTPTGFHLRVGQVRSCGCVWVTMQIDEMTKNEKSSNFTLDSNDFCFELGTPDPLEGLDLILLGGQENHGRTNNDELHKYSIHSKVCGVHSGCPSTPQTTSPPPPSPAPVQRCPPHPSAPSAPQTT